MKIPVIKIFMLFMPSNSIKYFYTPDRSLSFLNRLSLGGGRGEGDEEGGGG